MTWVIIMCTFSPMISSICAPGTSLTLDEFDVSSRTIGTLMITIYVLGYAVGPLFLAPLSEMYGRAIVINWSTAFFNAFLLGCSLAPNMPALIAMRLLAGIGGSAIMTIVSSCIGDVFRVHERAAASAIVIGTPSISPIRAYSIQISFIPLTGHSWTHSWRLHIAVSWLEMGILDCDDGYCTRQRTDVLVPARVKSSNYIREEDASAEEAAGKR